MNLLLFGPPGAGKGTQASLLVDRDGYEHISTGDLFRFNIKNNTDLGNEAKTFMDKGELVPDSVTIGMVKQALAGLSGKPFLLDGFPRTVPQAEALEELLAEASVEIGKVIFFDVPNEVLIERLAGRRVCKGCGAVYHVKNSPTEKDGVCDKCGGEVVQRNDDEESAVKNRLEVYGSTTRPVKDFYGQKGLVLELDGTGDLEDIYSRVKKILV